MMSNVPRKLIPPGVLLLALFFWAGVLASASAATSQSQDPAPVEWMAPD